ncbi:UNKNOWN [Stylonychia lemnae]|uniref:Uncharacterized protein n=1 Tax=Stylonychia lemnae TaxID=5949 RepID=A0A078A887_STYLE|nr:UNKNOWN [Stylonychia lemnae]|eukprot:CDW78081.1 UNKNOWN [Stylonychia lemnae]
MQPKLSSKAVSASDKKTTEKFDKSSIIRDIEDMAHIRLKEVEPLPVSMYEDLYVQKNLMEFSRDIALKFNELIEYIKKDRVKETQDRDYYEERVDAKIANIHRHLVKKSFEQRWKQRLFKVMVNESKTTANLKVKLGNLEKIQKQFAFRTLALNTLDEQRSPSPQTKVKRISSIKLSDSKRPTEQLQINLTPYQSTIKAFNQQQLDLNVTAVKESPSKTTVDKSWIKLSIDELMVKNEQMQAQIIDLKNQQKNHSLYQKIASISNNEREQGFLIGLFDDMQNMNEQNVKILTNRLNDELEKFNRFIVKMKQEQEGVITSAYNQLNQNFMLLKDKDFEQIKSDMKILFVKINHANESYLNIRKEFSGLRDQFKHQRSLSQSKERYDSQTLMQSTSRQQLHDKYDNFITQQSLVNPMNILSNQQLINYYQNQNYRDISQNQVLKHIKSDTPDRTGQDSIIAGRIHDRRNSSKAETRRPMTSKNTKKFNPQSNFHLQAKQRGHKTNSSQQQDLNSLLSFNQLRGLDTNDNTRNDIQNSQNKTLQFSRLDKMFTGTMESFHFLNPISKDKIHISPRVTSTQMPSSTIPTEFRTTLASKVRTNKGLDKLNKAIISKLLPDQVYKDQVDYKELDINSFFKTSNSKDIIQRNKRSLNSSSKDGRPSNPYYMKFQNRQLTTNEKIPQSRLQEIFNGAINHQQQQNTNLNKTYNPVLKDTLRSKNSSQSPKRYAGQNITEAIESNKVFNQDLNKTFQVSPMDIKT